MTDEQKESEERPAINDLQEQQAKGEGPFTEPTPSEKKDAELEDMKELEKEAIESDSGEAVAVLNPENEEEPIELPPLEEIEPIPFEQEPRLAREAYEPVRENMADQVLGEAAQISADEVWVPEEGEYDWDDFTRSVAAHDNGLPYFLGESGQVMKLSIDQNKDVQRWDPIGKPHKLGIDL
jgi:hypothetical protein